MNIKSADVKRMDARTFRELGLLQEVNRQFLHPRGLALEVVIDNETGETRFGGVWDYRDDPEGMLFAEAPDLEKVRLVDEMLEAHAGERRRMMGHVVQPLDYIPPPEG